LGALLRALLAVTLVPLLLIILQACISRKQVVAETWLNSGLPADVCEKYPEIKEYGIYRKLDSGQYEFLSYCKNESQNYISIQGDKFRRILDSLLPEQK
jgi:hypothetical protein